MAELTTMVSQNVIPAYDFSGLKRIVDVGGWHGQLLAAILKANTLARGVLFDLPHAMFHQCKPEKSIASQYTRSF